MNKANDNPTSSPYGRYAPDASASTLRLLTRLGLGRGFLRRWINRQWEKKGYEIVDVRVRGINYRLHVKANTTDTKILASSKVYDRIEIRALAAPLKNSSRADKETVFVDIGANTGYYSLSLAGLGYSKIIAIEPNPPTLEALRYNVKINNYDEVITVVPMCIGDGTPTPFYCSGGLGDASIFADSHDCEPLMVDSAPLLEILQSCGVSHIDAMKIDIEGFEDRALYPFFKSAPKSLWPAVVVIEVCNSELWQQDAVKMIMEFGYTMRKRTRANCILTKN